MNTNSSQEENTQGTQQAGQLGLLMQFYLLIFLMDVEFLVWITETLVLLDPMLIFLVQ